MPLMQFVVRRLCCALQSSAGARAGHHAHERHSNRLVGVGAALYYV